MVLVAAAACATDDLAGERDSDGPEDRNGPAALDPCGIDPDAPPGTVCDPLASHSHPLDGGQLVGGMVPGIDVIDSPSGKRYALLERVSQDVGQPQAQTASGVFELDRRMFDATEYEELLGYPPGAGPAAPVPTPPGPKVSLPVSDIVAAALANGQPGELIEVFIATDRPPMETVTHQLQRAIGLGQVQTLSDREAIRLQLVADRAAQVAANLAPTIAQIELLGGELTGSLGLSHTFGARIPASMMAIVATDPDIRSIAAPPIPSLDTHTGTNHVDGNVISEIHQFQQFHDANFTGENGVFAEIVFAMYDREQAMEERVHFLDGNGGASRVLGAFTCLTTDNPPGEPCSGEYDGIPNNHGNAVAGTIFGDLTDGQDITIAGAADRARRSGYAREAEGYFYDFNSAGGGADDWRRVWDDAVARSPAPAVFVESISDLGVDPTCRGEDSLSQAANEATYESGMLLINSIGNDNFGEGSTTNCVVTSPGSAIGTFSVNRHGGDDPISVPQAECDARDAGLSTASVWGGDPTTYGEGKGRTIIDLTAYGPQEYRHCADTNTDCFFNGTSSATPTVAAAAIDLVDMYKQVHAQSTFIDDPGVLTTMLLLMGDRKWMFAGNGGKAVSTYDQRWGAGRLRLRMLTPAGMDAPWGHGVGSTCVKDGEVVSVSVNGPVPISADADAIKAVAWWYDRRHEDRYFAGPIDNIDIGLRSASGDLLASGTQRYDNKERLYFEGIGGHTPTLELWGQDVTTDGEGCGKNAMRVYFAFLYEDLARNDMDGPSWNPGQCIGVEPAL
jgi:hypothetical protein